MSAFDFPRPNRGSAKPSKTKLTDMLILYLPDVDATEQLTQTEFKEVHTIHWGIECYHARYQAAVWNLSIYG